MNDSVSSPQPFGAVIFDHPELAADGWACESGGRSFRVSSTGDLGSGTIWYTNIQMAAFYQKGFRQSPKLRPEGFLRTQFNSVLIELGLKSEPVSVQVAVMAGLVGAVMEFAYLHLGISAPPVGALNNGLRQSCLPSDARLPEQVALASAEANQTFVECEKRAIPNNTSLISLVFHRYSHAKKLLENRFPSGNWSQLKGTSFPPSTAEGFRSWQARVDRPGLFQVDIKAVSPVINHLINYGAGAGMEVARSGEGGRYVTYKRRCFMTAEELDFMLAYADIDIEKVYLCDSYGPAPIVLPQWGNIPQHSYAYGLYTENLWTALTRSLDGKAAKSPLSAWLHTYDRLHCLKTAIEIDRDYGMTVHSYGYGRITLVVPDGSGSMMSKIAQNKKMIAPMATKESQISYKVDPKAGPAAIMQAAMDRRALAFLTQVNDRSVADAQESKRRQILANNSNRISL